MILDQYKVDVPVGRSGEWRVERFSVTEEEASRERMRAAFSVGGRGVPQGTYTRLMRCGTVVMSDTPDEIRDHLSAIRKARGHCLVNGLGLGMVAAGMLNAAAEKVTIVEKSQDVISLVAGHYKSIFGDRICVIHSDAFDYKPQRGERFGYVWHDICLLYTSPSPRDRTRSRMPSSA